MKRIASVAASLLVTMAAMLSMSAAPAAAQDKKNAKASGDNYDAIVEQYLKDARAMTSSNAAPGSLWMANLASDLRARRVNDLVTIRVIESVTGAGTADANLQKRSGGSAGVSSLFGLETRLPGSIDPGNLIGFSSSSNFQGGGSTARTGALSAVMTARVEEVLPNGDLLVQGVREIEINGDRQILVLTGVVRPTDISAGNVVPSTAVGQMRIRYFGRGLMKDNLTPGWLVRILNKIF
jgi:flagellar L-ring protein precursor FlgH